MRPRSHTISEVYSSVVDLPPSSVNAAEDQATRAKFKRTTRLSTAVSVYAIIELLAIICSAYFAHYVYHTFVLKTWEWHQALAYTPGSITIAVLVFLISIGFHNFSAIRRQDRYKFLWSGIGSVILAFSIFITILFMSQLGDYYSRGTLVFQIAAACIVVAVSRTFFYSWLTTAIASDRIEARRVTLIGDDEPCSAYTNRLKSSGVRSVGSFRFPKIRDVRRGATVSPSIRKMITEIRLLRPDDIIILANREITPVMLNLTGCLAELPAGVHIVPVDSLNDLASAQISQFGNFHTIELYRTPLSQFDSFIKRAFDIVFATLSLIAFSPLFLIVSIAIKLDSRGPIFFSQVRHGFNNDEINVLKFRSMGSKADHGPFQQTVEDDPRVTKFGRIIRRTNIDELPQLFNVLRGDMSIVGPRPHATAHNSLFHDMIAPFSRRHNVKPGITGWAQVNGFRGATDTLEKMKQRIEYDLYYVDNWSFLFDIKIIVMTLFSKRAYINAY